MPNVSITDTSNQIVLGTTRTITITAPTPATSSRTWTLPDLTTSPTFAALEAAQTFSGAKTFSAILTMSGATIAMGTNKITGIGNATAAQDAAAYTQVKVLQVISASSTTETSSTSASYADATGLTVTITPSSTSSKFLILASVPTRVRTSAQTDINGSLRLVGTTSGNLIPRIDVANATGSSTTQSIYCSNAMSYLDSPATVSTQTYKVQLARLSGAGTFYVCDGGSSTATITVLEINGL